MQTLEIKQCKTVHVIYVMLGFIFNRIGCLHNPQPSFSNLFMVHLLQQMIVVRVFLFLFKCIVSPKVNFTGSVSEIWKLWQAKRATIWWEDRWMNAQKHEYLCNAMLAKAENRRVSKSTKLKLHRRLLSAMRVLECKHVFMSIIKS